MLKKYLIFTLFLGLVLIGIDKVWAATNLDVSGDILWVDPTVAELNDGYSVRRAVVSILVDADTAWSVKLRAYPEDNAGEDNVVYFYDDLGGKTQMPVSDLAWRSFIIDGGDTQGTTSSHSSSPSDWEAFLESGGTTHAIASGTAAVTDAVIGLDYRIATDWQIPASSYNVTLTYELFTNASPAASGKNSISLTIDSFQILTGGGVDIILPDATAADLDRGYLLDYAATSLVIKSNQNWKVTVSASGATSGEDVFFWKEAATSDLAVTIIYWRPHLVSADEEMSPAPSGPSTWVDFNADGSSPSNVSEGGPGEYAKLAVDYKINVNWSTSPADEQSYWITLIYTLEPK